MTNNNMQEPKINPVMQATTPGYRHNKIVPMIQKHEGKELLLPMVILTSRESAEVESKAYQDTLVLFSGKSPKKDEPSNWQAMLDAQRAIYIVYYSVRTPGDLTKKWFLSKNQVEDTYTWDELDLLMNHHMTVRLTQPHLENVDPADPDAFQKVIDKIKKQGTESDFFFEWSVYSQCESVDKIFGCTARDLTEEQWVIYCAMRQYHNDMVNPDSVRDRSKKTSVIGSSKNAKMGVPAMAYWHNITDLSKILTDPQKR